jgi:hypothetical protein
MNRSNEPTMGGLDVADSSIETTWAEQSCCSDTRNENSRKHLAHARHMEPVADPGRLPAVGARHAGGNSVIKPGTRNDKVQNPTSGTIL